MTPNPKLMAAGRIWAGDPERLNAIALAIETMERSERERPLYETLDGVAFIDITGVMLKTYDPWYDIPGSICFTQEIRRALNAAERDDSVNAILLNVDSPGGLADGCDDLYQAVAAASENKPTIAYIDGLAASAGMYAIAGASEIIIGRGAFAGSIGTYSVIPDVSAAFAKFGIKMNVVSSAPPLKGAGVTGTEIKPEQLAMWQREVDALAKQFREAVQAGRGLTDEQVAAVATGETWIGEQAVLLGLADSIGTIDSAFAKAAAIGKDAHMSAATLVKQPSAAASVPASQVETETVKPASLSEIEAACVGASSDFVLGCVRKSLSAAEVATAYAAHLREQLAVKDAAIATEKARADAADAAKSEALANAAAITNGTRAVATTPGNGGATTAPENGDAEFAAVAESWPVGFDRKDWDAWKRHDNKSKAK